MLDRFYEDWKIRDGTLEQDLMESLSYSIEELIEASEKKKKVHEGSDRYCILFKRNNWKVRALDLLTYLQNYEPDELVKICRGNYSTKSHDSLKISNGLWYWFSRQVGGKSALDYLIKVRNYSFTEAVGYLINKLDNVVVNNQEKSIKDIELPPPASNNTIAINYLLKDVFLKMSFKVVLIIN